MAENKNKFNNHRHEEHHPPYVGIYFILVILTGLSILIAQIIPKHYVPPFVFTISTVKALLIALFYMHLKYEGKLIISLAVIPVLLTVLILLVLMPDIATVLKK